MFLGEFSMTVKKTIFYDNPQVLLRDYEQHLRHNGFILDWEEAPPSAHTPVELTLYLFPDQTPIRLKGFIAALLEGKVGVSLQEISPQHRAALEQSISFCRNIVDKIGPEGPPLAEETSSLPYESSTSNNDSVAFWEPPANAQPPGQESIQSRTSSATNGSNLSTSAHRVPSQLFDLPTAQLSQDQNHWASPAEHTKTTHKQEEEEEEALYWDVPSPQVKQESTNSSGSWIQINTDGQQNNSTTSSLGRDFTFESWTTLSHSIVNKEESDFGGSWISSGRYSKPQISDNFTPSRETWNHSTSGTYDNMFSSQADIPLELQRGQSSMEIPSISSLESSILQEMPSNLGYNAPVLEPPEGMPTYQTSVEITQPAFVGTLQGKQRHSPIDHRAPAPTQRPKSGSYLNPNAPSLTGAIEEIGVLELLSRFTQSKANGYLVIHCPEQILQTYLYKGNLMHVRVEPSDPKTLLGEILVRLGKINSQERNNALRKAEEQECPIGEILLDNGTITKRTLSLALRKQMQMRFGNFAEAQEGSFEYWDHRMPKFQELAPPTSPSRLFFRYKINQLSEQPYEVAQEKEERLMDRFLHPIKQGEQKLRELSLSKDEKYFYKKLINGQFRLREVYAASNFRHRQTYTLIFAMEHLGILSFEQTQRRDWQEAEMRDKFQHRFMLLGQEDYFGLLGIHWTASQEEIKEAYQNTLREYDIANYQGEWPDDIQAMSQKILSHLREIKKQLEGKEKRQMYRSGVHDKSKLFFSAQLLADQGDMAIYRRDFPEAIERYTQALELNPQLEDVAEKLKKSKLAYKKFREHIEANKDKNIDWQAKIRINAEHLGIKS